jgi:ParB/RepB/Spo0J family partition protein
MKDTNRRLVTELKPHPLNIEVYGKDALPSDFVQGIAKWGILTPLVILEDGRIVSGHRRWRAACQLGLADVPVRVQSFEDDLDIQLAILEGNRQREKTFSQKMREAKVWEEIEKEKAKRRQAANQYTKSDSVTGVTESNGRTTDAVAEAIGIGSGRQYSRAKKIWEEAESGNPLAIELVRELDEEEETITGAVRQLNRSQQEAERKERVENTLQQLPEGKYRTIVIDPPWPVQKILRDVRPRQVTMDYPTMEVAEIARLPVPDVAMRDGCHIYLWTTHKYLPEALDLFTEWGVKYQCLMTWVKPTGMTPFTWMYSTEHVLFGRFGTLKVQKVGLKLSFEAPAMNHSEKPSVFYERVREASPEPRLEMFARKDREGFTVWGNEIGVQRRP